MTAKDGKKKDKAVSGQMNGSPGGNGVYAPTSWGRGYGHHDLLLPSGDTILARRVGPTELVKSGMLAKVDVLSGIVQSDHIDRVAGKRKSDDEINSELRDLLNNPDKLVEAMGLIDHIVIMTVVQPKVLPNPGDDDPVDLNAIYIRSVPDDDKMFIFQWTLGGTTDLATFREELNRNVDTLSASEVDAE
jgi:hypothetical protein